MPNPETQRKLLLAVWFMFPLAALALLCIMWLFVAHGQTVLAMYLWPPVLALLITWAILSRR